MRRLVLTFRTKELGRKAPDPRARLEATWRAVIDDTRTHLGVETLIAGGKSMGGRMASYVAATGAQVDGLIFLGYPLHLARQQDKLRVDHFGAIHCPSLFIQGSKDALCDLTLLRHHLGEFGGPWELNVVEEGDHSYRMPKRAGRTEPEVWQAISGMVVGWLSSRWGARRGPSRRLG